MLIGGDRCKQPLTTTLIFLLVNMCWVTLLTKIFSDVPMKHLYGKTYENFWIDDNCNLIWEWGKENEHYFQLQVPPKQNLQATTSLSCTFKSSIPDSSGEFMNSGFHDWKDLLPEHFKGRSYLSESAFFPKLLLIVDMSTHQHICIKQWFMPPLPMVDWELNISSLSKVFKKSFMSQILMHQNNIRNP